MNSAHLMMCALHDMKRNSLIVILLALTGVVFGQDNDTALMRELGVVKLEKHLFVHGFVNKKDTCLLMVVDFDSLARPTQEFTNWQCQGYPDQVTMNYTYTKLGISSMLVSNNEGPQSSSSFELDEKGNILVVRSFNYQQNDSVTQRYVYYYSDHVQPDSSEEFTDVQFGEDRYTKTVTRRNSDGQIKSVITMDENRTVIQEVSFEYKGSLVVSMATATYGEQGGFMQIFYEYNTKGQLVSTFNSLNRQSTYTYYENGLLKNMFDYNAKGELEAEFIYKYHFK